MHAAAAPAPAPPTNPGLCPPPQVLALCSECLEKQRDLLAETHLLHLRVLSAAVDVLSYLRRFPEAAAYACRLLQGYR